MTEFEKENQMDRLMTDEEFAEFMAASYEEAGSPVDELGKRRVWQNLAELTTKRASRYQRWAPAVGFALVLLAVWWAPSPELSTMRIKGAATLPVSIYAYALAEDGTTTSVGETLTRETTLIFKYRLAEAGQVALLMQEDDGAAQVKFISSAGRVGDEQMLVRDGRTYGFAVEQSKIERLRVCLVAARTSEALQKRLQDVVFASLPEESCVDWEITD